MWKHEHSLATRPRLALAAGLLGAVVALALGANGLLADGDTGATAYYSTAAPPLDYPGPAPTLLALAEVAPAAPRGSAATAAEPVASPPASEGAAAVPLEAAAPAPPPARLASAPASPRRVVAGARPAATRDRVGPAARPDAAADPITEAKRAIAACQARYDRLGDYTCTFFKRERLPNGRLTSQHVMLMKARTRPMGIYFKFLQPNAGREAIWAEGRFGNKAVVHDVGLGKLLAGTLHLDPRSKMAMEDCRHPINEAGLGHMIREISTRWAAEMKHGETVVTIRRDVRVGDRVCTMIESKHPERHPSYLFHKVKVYIDREHDLPIRFEAYDWPRRGGQAELVEEYSYVDLKLDTGLSEHDFDPNNRAYSFGRF